MIEVGQRWKSISNPSYIIEIVGLSQYCRDIWEAITISSENPIYTGRKEIYHGNSIKRSFALMEQDEGTMECVII